MKYVMMLTISYWSVEGIEYQYCTSDSTVNNYYNIFHIFKDANLVSSNSTNGIVRSLVLSVCD